MEFDVRDFVAIVIVAALLMAVTGAYAQPAGYIPGTSTTTGAYTGPQSFTDYARVVEVTPIPGPHGQPQAWNFAADYKGQRLFGQATRRVNVGDMVPVTVTPMAVLQPIR